jgi:hypothetical protein
MNATARSLLHGAAVTVCLWAGGCVSSKKMPAAWETALVRGPGPPPTIEGVYVNRGRPRLDGYFWAGAPDPQPERIQLRFPAKNRLEVTALREGAAPVTKTVDIEFDETSGGVHVPTTTHFDALAAGAQLHVRGAVLFKGSDGWLYGHVVEGGAAAFAWVIPVVGQRKSWSRWAPAAP